MWLSDTPKVIFSLKSPESYKFAVNINIAVFKANKMIKYYELSYAIHICDKYWSGKLSMQEDYYEE